MTTYSWSPSGELWNEIRQSVKAGGNKKYPSHVSNAVESAVNSREWAAKTMSFTDMWGRQQKFTTNTWISADTETSSHLSQATTGNIQTGSLKLDTNADIVSYCNHSPHFDWLQCHVFGSNIMYAAVMNGSTQLSGVLRLWYNASASRNVT